ncbi:MAG: hypothetical protein ACUVXI_10960 [bacterium]
MARAKIEEQRELTYFGKWVEEAVKRVEDKLDMHISQNKEEFAAVNRRLDRVEERLDKMEGRLDRIDERLDRISGRVDGLGRDIVKLSGDIVPKGWFKWGMGIVGTLLASIVVIGAIILTRLLT